MRAEEVCLAARWRRPRSDPEHTERRSDTGQAAEKCSGAVNSAVECHLHTVEAAGSIPAPPTRCFSFSFKSHKRPKKALPPQPGGEKSGPRFSFKLKKIGERVYKPLCSLQTGF